MFKSKVLFGKHTLLYFMEQYPEHLHLYKELTLLNYCGNNNKCIKKDVPKHLVCQKPKLKMWKVTLGVKT